ncbi:HrcA family transcriptional regulator [Campylobacter sp. LH-2024]|uniref:HrcA family transcriptional regulator n=1 Tax=Campylobacter molothri TaxID=1032242 RepID=A0ACC5VYF0_9BACT|nr:MULTISPECIES: HrcA family transcriptional regulator [unclassified Campylobacter]MBZ7928285.1 HrcA family transcriptional regulator [Campylobacter sp. RM10542]MBZ7929223.1 HrcA family transcriptional regulator [Campylobacter sp. W0067]MBZ7930778.1 HrcA family transcriptional regulator [Campylobacter sp. RM12910]MBZ7933781.1 HrcA family transcriptional regulator [Campylobacter sp. W0065]MBZ7937169.1 HrcA family transcriptional regulator [Campylobacter sp. RM10538]MBZ7940235.1 HrcA family tra
MKNHDKKDLILDSIIETYLLDNVPIGSSELNLNLCIPASTIRVYLKRLSDEGLITQLHISSGRIPTVLTMQNYWQNYWKEKQNENLIKITNEVFLKELSKEFEIYCLVYGGRNLILKEIFNLNAKFIILDFEDEELVLKYTKEAWEFLKTLIGFDLFSIENIALRVSFMELVDKITCLRQNLIYYRSNEERAYQIYQNDEFVKLLDCGVHHYFKDSLEFEPLFKEGFMGLKVDGQFLGEDVNIILAGSVYTDYKKILKQIKEAA